MQSSIKKYIATLAFGACSTVAFAATAATAHEDTLVLAKGMEAASVRVELSDLNLDTAQGQQVLHQRISAAAREVCGSTDYRAAGGLRQAANNRACHASAFAEAVSQVGAERVAATLR